MKVLKGYYFSPSYGKLPAVWIEMQHEAFGVTTMHGSRYEFKERHYFELEEPPRINNLKDYFGSSLVEVNLKFGGENVSSN